MTDVSTPESPEPQDPRKGPLSFLSGALTAGLLAWLALGLSRRMVVYSPFIPRTTARRLPKTSPSP